MINTRGSALGIGYSFPIINIVLIAARFRFRRMRRDRILADDYFCLAAWLFVSGACASLLAGVYLGGFAFTPDESEAALDHSWHVRAQTTGAAVVLWMLANASVKLSILFFYRRIFRNKRFYIGNNILIGASVVWFVYSIISAILYCGQYVHDDFEGPWDKCPLWGFQMQLPVFILDSLIDAGIIMLPLFFLMGLKMELLRKVLVCLTFMVGGLAFVAGLMNTIYQFLLLTNPTDSSGAGTPPDQTSDGGLLLLNWPILEIGVGLIACNLPIIGIAGVRKIAEYFSAGYRVMSTMAARLVSPVSSKRSGSGSHAQPEDAGSTHSAAPSSSLAAEDRKYRSHEEAIELREASRTRLSSV